MKLNGLVFLFVLACSATIFLGGCATAAHGRSIPLSEEEAQACKSGGGCYLIPEAGLVQMLERAALEALEDAAKACKNAWKNES